MVKRFLDDHVIWWTGQGLIGKTFSSYALRQNGVTVWIDAVDPGQDLDAVLAFGKPDHLLITFGDHDRGVNALAQRYGAQVWVPEGQAPDFPKPDHVFRDGDSLPGGLTAMTFPGVGYGESMLHGEIAGKRAAFIGDAFFHLSPPALLKPLLSLILRMGTGEIQTKRAFRGGDTDLARRSLPKVLDLNLDAAFFSHGSPIAAGAHRALETSLKSF